MKKVPPQRKKLDAVGLKMLESHLDETASELLAIDTCRAKEIIKYSKEVGKYGGSAGDSVDLTGKAESLMGMSEVFGVCLLKRSTLYSAFATTWRAP